LRLENPYRRPTMRETEQAVTWVVYKMTLHGTTVGVNAVCSQEEWDALDLARPGYHTLVQAGITTEGEAEQMARVGPDGVPAGTARLKAR
jgi:hypothetical protein